jgi:hypothetical protein
MGIWGITSEGGVSVWKVTGLRRASVYWCCEGITPGGEGIVVGRVSVWKGGIISGRVSVWKEGISVGWVSGAGKLLVCFLLQFRRILYSSSGN